MPRKTKRDKELDELSERQDRERKGLLRKTKAETALLLVNPDGLARLKAISDEEWAEAEAKGGENGP